MKTDKWVIFAMFASSMMLTTCKKSDSPSNSLNPEPTPIGTPVDSTITKVIGPQGGSVDYDGGLMSLEFPAGAVSKNSTIVVQPITNNIPGGFGDVYSFEPANIKLNLPVTLKIHYTDKDMAGSSPMFTGIAFQDSARIWHRLRNIAIDTVNKTISGALPHFSHWGTFLNMAIVPVTTGQKINESKEYKVIVVDETTSPQSADGDELPPLPIAHEVSPGTVKQWYANGILNGDSTYGTITPNGSHCTYTAPDHKPEKSKNPVQLTADLDHLWYKDPATGADFKNLKLVLPIVIIDDNYSYQLKIEYKFGAWPGATFYWMVTDMATMDIEVKNGAVTITNIQNQGGNVSPSSQTTKYGDGTCTATWHDQGANIGYLNITQATGLLIPNENNPDEKTLSLVLSNHGKGPGFHLECSGSESSDSGGDDMGSSSLLFDFALNNEIQVNRENTLITATLAPQ